MRWEPASQRGPLASLDHVSRVREAIPAQARARAEEGIWKSDKGFKALYQACLLLLAKSGHATINT